MERLMTVRELALFLRRHENWVYSRSVAGALPSYKIDGARRFRRDEIERWLAARRDPGGGGEGDGAP